MTCSRRSPAPLSRLIALARCAACPLLLSLLSAGCATTGIESARNLATAGREVTEQSEGCLFLSQADFLKARDAEAFIHGYAGTSTPSRLLADMQAIERELAARREVFVRLDEAYAALYGLASQEASEGFEKTVARFGDAVNAYASVRNKALVLASPDKDAFAALVARAGARLQKRSAREACRLIRQKLEAFSQLLDDPAVREQLAGTRKNLSASRTSAIELLWEKRLLDPTPLISELAADAGLKAGKDALKILDDPENEAVREGLGSVLSDRLGRRLDLAERSYDACLGTVRELIAQHENVEAGKAFSQTRLRLLTSELQLAAGQLSQKAADKP